MIKLSGLVSENKVGEGFDDVVYDKAMLSNNYNKNFRELIIFWLVCKLTRLKTIHTNGLSMRFFEPPTSVFFASNKIHKNLHFCKI